MPDLGGTEAGIRRHETALYLGWRHVGTAVPFWRHHETVGCPVVDIFMTGPVTWELGIHIIQKLCFYDDGTKRPITIYISSPGGECDVGFAIIDCINKLKSKHIEVNTICIGPCSSMASVILASGTIGHRYAFPSSRIMIHQAGITEVGGKLDDINIIQHELQVWTDTMNKIFKKQTGKSLDELRKLTSYDNYMSASEAKKLGIIDKISAKMI